MQALSKRLKTIATLVPNGARVCDIGTDHGYLAIYLKLNNIAKTVIACDLNQKPLNTAQKNIESCGIKGIDLRLSDGFSNINPNEIDSAVIAGMGGEVISGILENCDWIKNKDYLLILQPTTSADFLRRFLTKKGFEIETETPVLENGKLYSIMTVRFTNLKQEYPEYDYYIGSISPKTDQGFLYIEKQKKIISKCINSLKNVPSKQEELKILKQAFKGIENILTE